MLERVKSSGPGRAVRWTTTPARRLGRQLLHGARSLPVPQGVREHLALMGRGVAAISGVAGAGGLYGLYAVIADEKHPNPWFWLFVSFAVLFAAQIRTVHKALALRRAAEEGDERISGTPDAIASLARKLSEPRPVHESTELVAGAPPRALPPASPGAATPIWREAAIVVLGRLQDRLRGR